MVMIMVLLCGATASAAEIPQYYVIVNRATNYVAVYTHDGAGQYTIPVIELTCSTGKNNKTPLVKSEITQKITFHLMNGGVYAQYATRFYMGCMFHAVYCITQSKDTLKTSEFNKLGEQASSGCVRLTAADAEWIYTNCARGTKVEVIDEADDFGPFGKPMVPKIPDGHPYAGWDPTDPDPNNPWRDERPVVQLVANAADTTTLSLPVGSDYDVLYSSIGLSTPDGTSYAEGDYTLDIYGVYDLNAAGTYILYVRGHDLATTLRGDLTVTLKVN